MAHKLSPSSPWIGNRVVEALFVLAPPFVALLIVMLFPVEFKNSDRMPVAYWVLLIVMIDVAHVYSTLYRTYFNPNELKKQHHLLIAVPVFCYFGGALLYTWSGGLFWRALAYLAVFHFIRQQYGFMRIYSRKEAHGNIVRMIDAVTIYTGTIYPLLYWHFTGTHHNFNWFVQGDFILAKSKAALMTGKYIYILVIITYLVKETWLVIKSHRFNLPRNLIVAGTYLSWYFGIIYYNGDMAFTTLNVVSHGLPYMALIWLNEQKRYVTTKEQKTTLLRLTFSTYGGVFCFAALLICFAYIEEGLWDGLVWREHGTVFRMFTGLPTINTNFLLALVVPLLALPQSTHYVLDGFIWKLKRKSIL
ncbi:hypothetical protein KXD93_22135 [Mucilaginibacter sp. BJC16-A38]|uniref:hypothetical protein n=1 Tax=Mucilaginibacter phenanthrenivorans TaxID=1234842 RepID=UPI0021586D87|nr:hypothetical protein [Mucilaginibacter phenanthrenivorans]MCR8560369.1 hypothetical protein [Mucilaginibacter phenanthrenivorans]